MEGMKTHGVLSQDLNEPVRSNVRLTLTRLSAGRSVPDLTCAAMAWPYEASFFVKSYLPTRVRLGLLSYQQLKTNNRFTLAGIR